MRKRRLPNIVTILVLTTITVFTWIALDVYRALTTKPAPVVPPEISEPLNPNLDTQALLEITERIHYNTDEITPLVPSATSTPEPTPAATVTPTVEPSVLPSPSSSPSEIEIP